MNPHATLMKPALIVLSVLALLLWGAVAPAAHAAPQISMGARAVVTNTGGDSIRIRAGAGTAASQIGTAREGEVVVVLSQPKSDGSGRLWYRVQAQLTSGWIAADFLSPQAGGGPPESSQGSQISQGTQTSQSTPQLSGMVRVVNTNGDTLNLRFEPTRTGKVIALLTPGSSARVAGGPVVDSQGEAWYQLATGDHLGWSMGKFLAQEPASPSTGSSEEQGNPAAPTGQLPASAAAPQSMPSYTEPAHVETGAGGTGSTGPTGSPEPNTSNSSPGSGQGSGERIVDNAMQYVGYRYRFGGASPAGFDCSGFIYYVMNKSGVPVGRDIYSQINSGQRVSRSDLQPGDLVYFTNTYKPGLSHAGIYIGAGKFVHAENESTGVLVSLMQNPYYASRYYTAVRTR